MLTKGNDDEGHVQSGMLLDYDVFEPRQVQLSSAAPPSPTTSLGYTTSSSTTSNYVSSPRTPAPQTPVKTESRSQIPVLTPRQTPRAPKTPTSSPVRVAVSPIACSRSQLLYSSAPSQPLASFGRSASPPPIVRTPGCSQGSTQARTPTSNPGFQFRLMLALIQSLRFQALRLAFIGAVSVYLDCTEWNDISSDSSPHLPLNFPPPLSPGGLPPPLCLDPSQETQKLVTNILLKEGFNEEECDHVEIAIGWNQCN